MQKNLLPYKSESDRPMSSRSREGVDDVLEMSLWNFISNRNVSVRLHNCLKNATAQSQMPFNTVQEYLEAGKSALAEMARLANLGKKTAYELDNLIHEWAEKHKIVIDDQSPGLVVHKDLEVRSIAEIVNRVSVSSRLRNAVSRGILPFKTIGEYISAGNYASGQLYGIQNVGRKTVSELIKIIDNYIKEEIEKKIYREKLAEENKDLFKNKDIVEVIENEYISIAIKKKLKILLEEKVLVKLSFFDHFLDNGKTLESIGFSRQEINEIDKCFLKIFPQINCDETKQIGNDFFLKNIKEHLNPREFGVLVKRTGLFGERKYTLDELGEIYLLTRERIRQIYKKAVKKLRESSCVDDSRTFIQLNRNHLEKGIFHLSGYTNEDLAWQRIKLLSPINQLAIEIGFEDVIGWLDFYYRRHQGYWWLPSADLSALPQQGLCELSSYWKNEIKIKTELMAWPVEVESLMEAFPQLMNDDILRYLREGLGAKIEGGVIVSQEKLSLKARISYVLRAAARALHTSEIRARIKEMFDMDVAENYIGSTLQLMENALIVSRGHYNLYENLFLKNEDLSQIREMSYSFLSSVGGYVSAKVIYKNLFKHAHERYGVDFSSYMLFGILQDDARFSIRRGLMVAIAGSGADCQFSSLTEEVISLVFENGPVQIKDVVNLLKEKRSVLEVTIKMILDGSNEIVASDVRGYYDAVNVVIGGPEKIEKLNDCIDLSLIDGAKSLHYIKTELIRNGIDLKIHTIKSWLKKLDRINFEKGVYSLVNASQEITTYQEKFIYLQQDGLSAERLKEALCLELNNQPEKRFITLDSRLKSSRVEAQSSSSILDSILEEFNF